LVTEEAAEPSWLTADEQRAWRNYIEATTMLLEVLDRQLQQDSGMPHGYYEILVRLSEADEFTMRMSELADSTRSSRSRLSHAVSRLEERGWVARRDCETDRRGQLAQLTAPGHAALAAAAPGHVATVRAHMIDALSADQIRQLGDIAQAMIDNLGAAPVSAAGRPST
jgi:DNA-binding MarR family transcriptional regulator